MRSEAKEALGHCQVEAYCMRYYFEPHYRGMYRSSPEASNVAFVFLLFFSFFPSVLLGFFLNFVYAHGDSRPLQAAQYDLSACFRSRLMTLLCRAMTPLCTSCPQRRKNCGTRIRQRLHQQTSGYTCIHTSDNDRLFVTRKLKKKRTTHRRAACAASFLAKYSPSQICIYNTHARTCSCIISYPSNRRRQKTELPGTRLIKQPYQYQTRAVFCSPYFQSCTRLGSALLSCCSFFRPVRRALRDSSPGLTNAKAQ